MLNQVFFLEEDFCYEYSIRVFSPISFILLRRANQHGCIIHFCNISLLQLVINGSP